MREIDLTKPSRASAIEQWPWPIRAALGCVTAAIAVELTYAIQPLHAVPLLLAFPTVILTAWFLGMWGGVLCAFSAVLLVDTFLTGTHLFLTGFVPDQTRLFGFLFVSILLGWAVRRLAGQRAQLATEDLQRRLVLANTDRQLAEERARATDALRDRDVGLQLALESNGMGLWIWDLQMDTVDWSDEVYRIAGRTPGSIKPTFESWMQLVHSDDRSRLAETVRRTRQDGMDYHSQYRVLQPDGSVRWVESQGKCQRDSDAKVIRVVGVLADVTNRKKSEEAMLRTEKLVVAGRLAASVAHEINNPLEAVANLLYLISHAATIESAQTMAHQALDELMRVSLITQQTLKFHRQTGAPKMTKLSEIIQTLLTLFRGRLRSSQISTDLRAEQEVSIACMPGEVQQIFANLISNAIDAMPQSGRMVIRLRPSRDWRDRKTLGMRATFCDTGMGMDRMTIEKMFEPFFTTKPETGTGLGMWVVAQLLERHHGHVRVWSTQRTNASATMISVFLPFGDASATVSP